MRDVHALPGADHLVDGVRLHVVGHGVGDGLPLLMVHGVPTTSYLWRDVQRDLGHHHRTWAVDLLGLGGSERPAGGRYDLASQADLLLHLLDELELDEVGLVGHDVGGGVALHLAASAPKRVAALALIDAPVHADVWPVPAIRGLQAPVLGELQAGAMQLVPAAARRYLGAQLGRGLRTATLPDHALTAYAGTTLSGEGLRSLLRVVRAFDPAGVESALQIVAASPPPTLVLWGDDDVWHDEAYGRRVAASLPGARFVCVADAGHFLPEDRPERVAEELTAFLADP